MIIQTPSFNLAIYAAGSPGSDKIALVLPGKLDTKDYAHMRSHVDYLAKRGYYAVSFDPPGTWESPGENSLYTISNYLQAVDELIEYFGNKPTVLVGHSRGGNVAMLAAGRNPYISHVIAIMSPSGPTTADSIEPGQAPTPSYRDLPPGTERTTNQKQFVLTAEYYQDQLQYDALDSMRSSTIPKLFFYGTTDVLVRPETVQAMYEAAAQPKMLHELQCEHDYRLHPGVIAEVNTTIEQFLAQVLV